MANQHVHHNEEMMTVDVNGLLLTLSQIDAHLFDLNKQEEPPKWARSVALMDRLETLELDSHFTKFALDPTGTAIDPLMTKAMEDLMDQMAGLKVSADSNIARLGSNLNRVKKMFRTKPTMADVMMPVDNMFEFRKHFTLEMNELEHTITMNAEQVFWDNMEDTMDRLKTNEDFSMKSINKVSTKLANANVIVETYRNKVQAQKETITGWVKRLHVQSDKNGAETAAGREYAGVTTNVMDDVIGTAVFTQDAADEDFIEYRDAANERLQENEDIAAATHDDFDEARDNERKRMEEMKAFTEGCGTFFDALVTDHNHSKNELPQTVMERQDFIDVIRYEQTGGRSSVDAFMQELQSYATAAKVRQHEVDITSLSKLYDDGNEQCEDMSTKVAAANLELVTQVEVMEEFPKTISALEKKMEVARGLIRVLGERVEALLKTCASTISDVHNLYSIKDEVDTMLETIENREQRVKRVRAELSAIAQSTEDNGNLLIEAFKEIAKQDEEAQAALEAVRKSVMDSLKMKQDAMDLEVNRIQSELDDLTGADTAPETVAVARPVAVTAAAAQRDSAGNDGGLLSRQAVLDQQTNARAGDMAKIFGSYFKYCEKENSIKALNKKDAEKTTILTMAVSDLMASSTDIDVLLKIISSDEAGPADSIPHLRARKVDLFIKDMQLYARENEGGFSPLAHECLNKYSTLLRKVINMNMSKHEHILVDDELTPEQRMRIPKCLACDRPMPSEVRDHELTETMVIKRGHFPSFGDATRDQGDHVRVSVDGGDFSAFGKKRVPKGGKLASLSQASVGGGASNASGGGDFLSKRDDEKYKLVAGFRMKQSQSMSSIGVGGSQLR